MKPCSLTVCVCKASAVQNVFCNYFAQLCFDSSLNPHNVKNRSPILKGALDTLNTALHLWWSSWLQHWVKAGQRRETAPLSLLSFLHTSTNMKYAAPAEYSVHLCGYVRALVTYSLHAWEMCDGTVYLQSMIIVSVSLSLASWKGGWPQTSMKRITPRLQISAETQRENVVCLYWTSHYGQKKTVVFVRRPENKDDWSTKWSPYVLSA